MKNRITELLSKTFLCAFLILISLAGSRSNAEVTPTWKYLDIDQTPQNLTLKVLQDILIPAKADVITLSLTRWKNVSNFSQEWQCWLHLKNSDPKNDRWIEAGTVLKVKRGMYNHPELEISSDSKVQSVACSWAEIPVASRKDYYLSQQHLVLGHLSIFLKDVLLFQVGRPAN